MSEGNHQTYEKMNEWELLFQLYKINSKSSNEKEIISFILHYLSNLNLNISQDTVGNIFISKGETTSYPCVAAHLDEVHLPAQRILHTENNIVFATDEHGERVGIGADDKNGIWVALQLLQTKLPLKVALFVHEEKLDGASGCVGSMACDLEFFNDVKYIVECDRKGANDIVICGKDVPLCDADFIPQEIAMKFGYMPVNGGITDVVALKRRGLSIPVCNVSCGYYNAHKSDEYTNLDELKNCLEFIKTVIRKK